MDELYDREAIEQCLNCPAEECWDCQRWGKDPMSGGQFVRKLDLNKFIKMYNAGLSVPEMATELRITESALYQRIDKRFKLPVVRSRRPKIDWQYFTGLSESIQSNLIWRRPI